MSKLDYDIIKMNNSDIKKEILSINKVQLENIKKASYFNVVNSILGVKELLENQMKIDDFKFTKELDLFNNYIEGSINSVTLSMSESNKKEELENLKKIREEIYETYSILEGYLISISYIGEFIDEYGTKLLAKKDYSNTIYDDKKVDELATTINQILNDNKNDYTRYIYIISELISILPMRLAKENYFNIIKNTLMRNLSKKTKSEVQVQINDYKKQFDSSSRDGYGIKFDYYFTETQKLMNINLKDKDLEELGDLVNKNVILNKELNELININLILGLITNMNIVISLLGDMKIDEDIKNIYDQWQKLLKNKNEKELQNFTFIIKEKIEDVEKSIFKDLDRFQNLNMEAASRKGFDDNELNEELLYTQEVLIYYNDSQFMDSNIIFPKEDEKLNYEYLEQCVDSLIQYINRSTKNMDNFERKIRMRKLLSIIELPFAGINDFINYIKYSLDSRIMDKEEISFKVDHIYYFLNEFSKSL